MNVTITVNGSHATVQINGYAFLSGEAKNRILNFIVDEDNETVDYIKAGGYIIVTGEVGEMKQLFELLWDLM